MTWLRLFLAAALVGGAGSTAVARDGAATQEAAADTVERDTTQEARRDTIQEARRDTAQEAARRDTVQEAAADAVEREAARRELEALRQGLGGEGFPERDSIFQQLSRLPGFRAIEYRGREVELDVEREEVGLRGESQANYTGSVLQADSIRYRIGLQLIAARGDIRLVSEDRRQVASDSMLYYDVSRLKGTIMDARTSFAEGGTEWFVRGTATPKGTRTVYVERGDFTTCDLEEPHYWFQAGKIKVVSENYIVAWPIVLYIHGIPVAWLPFFAQDIRPDRRSGFLPPRFGFNDLVPSGGGSARSVTDFGYYLAINRFLDAQFTVDWLSGSYTRLNGAFRYNFLKKFLRGNVLTSYSFGEAGRTWEVQGSHNQDLGPGTSFRANAHFIQNTRLFEDRSFDPTEQTQTIRTDVGFNHRFPFASLNLSMNRNQQLGAQRGQTTMTLPRMDLTFSPLTLFRAPPGRGGAFNNMVLSGSLNFSRSLRLNETRDDQTTTDARGSSSLRVGSLGISGSGSFSDLRTTPFDSVGTPPPPFSRTNVTWSVPVDYQLDLMGSTVLRPNVRAEGGAFRSPDTDDAFIATPTRYSLGATLTTDLYGFFPGFGPFTRIRHKVSPSFSYTYAPEVTIADSLLQIPGFPAGAASERNQLSVTLRQTFEARVRPSVAAAAREPGAEPGEGDVIPEEMPGAERPAEEVPPEELPEEEVPEEEVPEEEVPEEELPGEETPEEVPEEEAAGEPQQVPARPAAGAPGARAPRPPAEDRKIVLLALNSDPLVFDFTREDEPALITDRWSHGIGSDLLRGIQINVALDLFEGTGPEREFRPMLSELTGSVSIRSGTGLAGLFGLGGPGAGAVRTSPFADPTSSRRRLQRMSREPMAETELAATGGGPWSLSLSYSLRRFRESEPGEGRQQLRGGLQLRPTPNWSVRWETQYDISDREFEMNMIRLERLLHDWLAGFTFSRSPNGNFVFQVMVTLIDAPDLRVNFDRQVQTAR